MDSRERFYNQNIVSIWMARRIVWTPKLCRFTSYWWKTPIRLPKSMAIRARKRTFFHYSARVVVRYRGTVPDDWNRGIAHQYQRCKVGRVYWSTEGGMKHGNNTKTTASTSATCSWEAWAIECKSTSKRHTPNGPDRTTATATERIVGYHTIPPNLLRESHWFGEFKR